MAQWIEHLTTDQKVGGSSPFGRANDRYARQRNRVRNMWFDAVRDYLINNFGAVPNVKNLLDYFNNDERVSIKRETLNRHVQNPVDLKISLSLPEI